MPDKTAKTILIVEDEELITTVLTARLESLGYRVLSAQDGMTGFKLARKEKPDLSILDIGLPKMDGNTLCELIKTEPALRDSRIIMLTGKKLVGDMEAAFKSGAEVYVNKPYEWTRLLGHIRKLLGETA